MAKLTKAQRAVVARDRLVRLLDRHGVATMRTIEQKIADAGPFNQRINPHVLTEVRNALSKEGVIGVQKRAAANWYYATATDPEIVSSRLEELVPLYERAVARSFTTRVGDALEISVYKGLLSIDADFQGRFRDLDKHDDSTPYSKEEPPSHIGKRELPGDLKLDFHYRHDNSGWAGIECKNIREWIYPQRREVRELITKAYHLDCIPVLIGRRIHPSTVFVFGKCGLIVHQNFNQLLPYSEAELAEELKHKNKMGYFDIRVGNTADSRMVRFLDQSLPAAMPGARDKWQAHADLVKRYATDPDMSYDEFAGRIARRSRGENEDGFEPPPHDPDDYA